MVYRRLLLFSGQAESPVLDRSTDITHLDPGRVVTLVTSLGSPVTVLEKSTERSSWQESHWDGERWLLSAPYSMNSYMRGVMPTM